MGWLDIAFDAAMLSTQISQRNKLQQLQQQHAEAAVIQAVVLALRQEIFKFKQTAEEIVVLAATYPKQAAGALEILYQRFQQAGLTPDLFPELGDKEYVAATTRYLREQREQLLKQLTPPEQLEVRNVADAALRLPRYKEYLAHYGAVMKYYDALPIYETLKPRNSRFTMASCLGGLMVMGLGTLPIFAALLLEDRVPGYVSGLLLFLFIPVSIFLSRWYTRPTEFKRVKSVIETTKAEINLDQFHALEKEFGEDYEPVHRQQQDAQQLINQFFAGGNFSAMLNG